MVADIAKMYRQIAVASEDTNLQRIVWRESPDLPIQDFRLLTVTYGTASAPYTATKCLQQLSYDEEQDYPLASKTLRRDFYVDDFISGADSTAEALELQSQLIQLLARGQFQLRKWSSNDPALLAALPCELRETKDLLEFGEASIKTLGIKWKPSTDNFSFSVKLPPSRESITKRTLLSDMAKVFDPLGWLSPTTIKSKILFQSLWKSKFDWDDPLPDSLKDEWTEYRSQLPLIEDLQIKRCITTKDSRYELHAFCDASEKAYAATVYLKSVNQTGEVTVHLVAAKTRVAPLKQVTLPRLELCAAVLLTKLLKLVLKSFTLTLDVIQCWSDSTIVLNWINQSSTRWKTFVGNRVAEIQKCTTKEQWRHVPGTENPADCASRGIYPEELLTHPIWWNGPQWLTDPTVNFPCPPLEESEGVLVEEKKEKAITLHVAADYIPIQERFSSWLKMIRMAAYCLRFITNCKMKNSDTRIKGQLTVAELGQAQLSLIKSYQQQVFGKETKALITNKPLPKESKILNLNPFLDQNGVMRVGGRLRHAKLSEDKKHPILIPRKGNLTDKIVSFYHVANLHAGPQLLLASLQQKYWIVNGRQVVRRITQQCIPCHRHKARFTQQMMADLPAARITPTHLFLKTGVDYAGPISLKIRAGRGQKIFKAYIALFVCFATRAIHLELVTDLSTDAFLKALKRFVSRRGKPSHLYSDCGTNFVGANADLKDFLKLTKSLQHQQTVSNYLTDEGIQWTFNPPASPNFGGLWEAGVKSMKFHLRRVLGNGTLTHEDMSTLLTQVEACLNSRPLTPLTSDPDDLEALTPGHFLVGRPLTAIPEPDYTDLPVNRLNHFQHQQQLLQHFWRRWSSEYLTRLQQRPKWLCKQDNMKEGDLVLLKDEDLKPQQWKLCRILTLHPGKDDLVRVATVKTSSGILKRPTSKLSPLPLDNNTTVT